MGKISTLPDYKKMLVSEGFTNSVWRDGICLFLGAGVARNLGMPNWKELAIKITRFCLDEKMINNSLVHTLEHFEDPLKIISYCFKKIKEHKKEQIFDKFLCSIFRDEPRKQFEKYKKDKINKQAEIYKDLIQLYESGKVLFVQTNYDDIIETYAVKSLKEGYVPYCDKSKKELDNSLLIYLHGKIDRFETSGEDFCSNLVLSKEKYNEVYVKEGNSRGLQEAFINKLLTKYCIIFLGYSLQDIEILQLIVNKPKVEEDRPINIIIDTCEAKQLSNEITASYIKEASNNNINVYTYSAEKNGIEKQFKKVVKDIKKAILSRKDIGDVLTYVNGEGIEFNEN